MSETVEEYLARKTVAELEAGIRKGLNQLGVIEALEQSETMQGDGPERLSRAYEEWSASDYQYRRRQLNSAIADSRAELARRGISEDRP